MLEIDPRQIDAVEVEAVEVEAVEVEAALERLVRSEQLKNSPRLQQFLTYVVRQTLAGEARGIKGPSIANSVYEISDMDTVHDTSVVRVEAGRLRKLISRYYAEQGALDPVRVDLPKGGYVPRFQRQSHLEPSASDTPRSAARRSRSVFALVGITLFSVAGIALAAFLAVSGPDPASAPGLVRSPNTVSLPTIAILPFRANSDDRAVQIVAQGLSDNITADLVQIKGINVIASTSAAMIGELSNDLGALRQSHDISHLLVGAVQKVDTRYHVTAELIEVKTGLQAWGKNIDQDFSDLFDAQNALSAAVISGLAIELNPVEEQKLRQATVSAREATVLFRQGLDIANPPTNPNRLKLARTVFSQLADQFPEYSGGYSGEAYILAFMSWWGHSPQPEQTAKDAIERARVALELDRNDGLAYAALAFAELSLGHPNRAVEHSWNSVRLRPGDPYLLSYHGFILSTRNEFEQSVDFARRAVLLDPMSVRTPFRNILAVVHLNAGRYQEALDIYAENSRFGSPVGRVGLVFRASAMAATGDRPGALSALDEADKFPAFNWNIWLKHAYSEKTVRDRIVGPLAKLGYRLQ